MDIFSSPQAWNNEPVDRTVVYNSADFTSVFPHRCHRSGISVVGSQQRRCPAFDKASPGNTRNATAASLRRAPYRAGRGFCIRRPAPRPASGRRREVNIVGPALQDLWSCHFSEAWKCELQIRDRILLPRPNLIEFSVTNERIGDVSKRLAELITGARSELAARTQLDADFP